MHTQKIVVNSKVGLCSRAATYFIETAKQYRSRIWVKKDECIADAKSLLGILSLCVKKGTPITLIADGQDEKEAIDALLDLIISMNENHCHS